MIDTKKRLLEENSAGIIAKEQELKASNEDLEILSAKLKVEKKASEMEGLKESLKEDFKYSIQALEDMIIMEQNRNSELEKDLEVLKFRKDVIESQFSDSGLD